MKRIFLFIAILLFASVITAQEQPIPNTQVARDRFVVVDAKVESKQSQTNHHEDKLFNDMKWGFGLILLAIYGLIGYIIYDRRTTLAPVENKTERIIKSLREAAEKDPVLREALKKTALW